MSWQPISAAPKDGTIIIATDGHYRVFCKWRTYPPGSYTDGNWSYEPPPVPSRDPSWFFYPSHWMPALEPPDDATSLVPEQGTGT